MTPKKNGPNCKVIVVRRPKLFLSHRNNSAFGEYNVSDSIFFPPKLFGLYGWKLKKFKMGIVWSPTAHIIRLITDGDLVGGRL